MTSEWALRRCLDRVAALGDAHLESHLYRAGVLGELRAVVSFDGWVWPLADPVTTVGIAPMAQVPGVPELPLLIALRYRTLINRWTVLPTHPSRAVSLQKATGNEPGRSEMWKELLERYGVVDVLSVAFADKWGLWGWLELWRGPGDSDFSDAEAHCVESMAGLIATGLRECSAREFQLGVTGDAVSGHRQAVLVLADDLSVISQTESAVSWLELLQRAPQPYQGIPAEVLNVAAQLMAVERGVDAHPSRSCRHVGQGIWAGLSAARMTTTASGATAPITVTIQDCLPAERLAVFERSFALSPRECQLLERSAAGLDTAGLAGHLGISRYTVQDIFKALFGKCGVQSRGALLAMALGPLAATGT
ncbi:helix-turn-helix transcriptional regulator [Arthrobacter glacialis]|uniref:helix-turn-helix transcriptional regulator n=1 Tax=Arthrobacter glacialis TaxID=1664 RepID=UPI000CD3E4CF|nr:LuxR C-terminal-related transcriptional regulator [Arthrobacter glacialis]POH58066.1 LuxR family transcriptional regulator [Arthrobacter glacialis]